MIQAPDWSAPLFMGSHSTRLTIFVPPHIDPSPFYAMKIISLGSRFREFCPILKSHCYTQFGNLCLCCL